MTERIQHLATKWNKGQHQEVATAARELKAPEIALLATEICNRYGNIQAERFANTLKN